MFELKKIYLSEAILLRQKVILPNSALEECKYAGDESKETIHVGAYAKGVLVGVASFYKEYNSKLKGKKMYRLKGLAIDPDHRNELRGQTLILFGENLLAQNEMDTLWCKTRASNLPYYQHLGFHETGETFNHKVKGLQVLMVKHF
ncbi:GNAT family N-acetyltransferase [Heyndrickxia acidicola]|uniref:GNAT family N-acetyltransferase n=1 Tax=Heyndrickxia acidicola TaxID=209389 RepID=A0ABU6MH90_9BACI|nr:GNAT family N-acetyltransferase [Heyndrickxia acidicola]MED1203870.1 GNAT family N-acetyltransferase [Heyndrickxia acidicola]